MSARSGYPEVRFFHALLFSLALLPAPQAESQVNFAADESAATAADGAAFPAVIKLSGSLKRQSGDNPSTIVGMTFSLYEDRETTVPLWSEVQNVEVSKRGDYTVLLGSTTLEGIPSTLFTGKQPRWLGVRVENGPEEPRFLLLSVPYAMKAADADTIGGRPASDFVTIENVSNYTQHALQQYLLDNPEIAKVASDSRSEANSTGSVQVQGSALQKRNQGVRSSVMTLDAGPGPNAGVAIAQAYADCPATGCVIDARGLTGDQVILQDPFDGGTKPVTLLLGIATYTTSATITLPSRSQLRGEGSATVLKAAANLGQVPLVRNASNWVTSDSERDWGLVVTNLTLDGSGNSGPGWEYSSCVQFQGVVDSAVERVWCISPRGDGLYVGASKWDPAIVSTRIVFNNNYITGAGRNGISVTGATFVSIDQNSVSGSYLYSIDLESSFNAVIRNILVTGNLIDRNGGQRYSIGISLSCATGICSDVLIHKNTISNQTGAGISFRGVPNLTITENLLRSIGSTGIGQMHGSDTETTGVQIESNALTSIAGPGIWVVGNASGWTISGNQVQDATEVGIRLGTGSSRMIVSGNSVVRAGNHGIYAQGTSNSSFSANRLEGCKGSGIILLAGSGIQASGNVVSNNVAHANSAYGIVENPSDSPDFNLITGNILSENVLAALNVKNAPHSVYSPNIAK